MIIERACRADVPAMTVMLRRFHDACALPWEYDAPAMSVFLAGALESGLCLVQREPDLCGVLVAQAGRPPWGGPVIVQERLWWVDEGHRSAGSARAFLTALEAWARQIGAGSILASTQATSDARIASLYGRAGFRPRETHFMKSL